jgi:hypothetical protein
MKSGNLNFLEPSGPIQDCNGTVLPFDVIMSLVSIEYGGMAVKADVTREKEVALESADVT